MKKKYRLLTGGIVLIVLSLAYAGVTKYMKHAERKEQEQSEAQKLYMTDLSDVRYISYDNDGTILSFTKNGETWNYDGDDQFPVNASRMDSLADVIKKLPAVRKLEGGDDKSAYGLDTPVRRVSAGAQEKEEVTVLIGNKTEDGSYYAIIDGEDTPWLISSSLFDETAYGLEDMLALEQFPSISGTDIQSITLQKENVTEHYIKKKLDEDGDIAWYRGDEATKDNKLSNNSSLNVLADSLCSLIVKDCVNYKVTDEDLADYGLDHPAAVLSYTYDADGEEKTFSLEVGKTGDDGTTYYTRTKDSRYVNEVDKTAMDKCMSVDAESGG